MGLKPFCPDSVATCPCCASLIESIRSALGLHSPEKVFFAGSRRAVCCGAACFGSPAQSRRRFFRSPV
eukprot:9905770-Lingulodinium_polyedra.AAC.1